MSSLAATLFESQGITQPGRGLWRLPGPTIMLRAGPTLKLDPASKITWVAQGYVQPGVEHLQGRRLLGTPGCL